MIEPRWFGAMLECPECGKRQHPLVAAFDEAGPSLLVCSGCGSKGTPGEFGVLSWSERAERRRAQWRAYYHSHKDECRERNTECARRYRERHRERINERNRERRAADPEAAREREAAYRAANRERINARHKEWRDAKRERMGEAAFLREQRMRCREYRKGRKLGERIGQVDAILGGSE